MKLKGKIAIVTGGGRGIGRAIALALATEGTDVVVAARTQAEIEAVATEIENLGRRALAISADMTKLSDVVQLAKRTHAEFGKIDILVSNAGGAPSEMYDNSGSLEMPVGIWESSEKSWDTLIDANLKSVFLCMKAVMPYMIEQGEGDVINIASAMGRRAGRLGAAYAVAKHAVIGLTQNAALQASEHGVRINAVSPGLIDTPGQRRLMATMMPEDKFPPMDSAESVARGVVYLLCDAPKTMTGQSLDLFQCTITWNVGHRVEVFHFAQLTFKGMSLST